VTDPLGHVTTLAYSGGLVSAVTDFAGRTTTFNENESDVGGQVLSITGPDPNVLGGPNGPVTQFQYGAGVPIPAAGRITPDSDSGTGDLLAQVTDPMGNVTTYAFSSVPTVSGLRKASYRASYCVILYP
jgi:hypothetical protein